MSYVIAILRDAYTPDLQGMRSVRFYTERDDNTHPEQYDTVKEAQEQIDIMENKTYLLSHNECSQPEYLIVEDSTAEYILSGRDGDGGNYNWDDCDCDKNNGECCGECQTCLTHMIDQDRLYIRNEAVAPQNLGLHPEKYYMNPSTGTIQTGADWQIDRNSMNAEQWGTSELEEITEPKTLDELFVQMKNNYPSLPSWDALPTFGGPDIKHTVNIWSWDESRKIVGTCSSDIEIVDRDDI